MQKTASEMLKTWHFPYSGFWATCQCRGYSSLSVALATLLTPPLACTKCQFWIYHMAIWHSAKAPRFVGSWQRWSPQGHILKSLALASRPQVLENCPVLGSRTAVFFELLKFCGVLEKFFGKRFFVEIA